MSFRTFIELLDKEGVLVHVRKPVDPRLEMAGVLHRLDGKPVIFEDVKGFPGIRVVAGICGDREYYAKALEIRKEELIFKLGDYINRRKEPRLVQSGACQEVVEADPSLDKIPILFHTERDGNAYLSASVVVVKDPKFGRNISIQRLMRVGPTRLAIRMVEGRGTHTAFESTPDKLPVAICVGNSVPVLLAAAISPEKGVDEYGIAQAMEDTPLVKCKTVDLEVPADCELVIEGFITKERVKEGPFVDLTETLDRVRDQPIIEVTAITHRKDYIYQALLPGGQEHKLLMGMPREPTIYNEVRKVCDCKNVLITPGGCSWLHALVQIRKNAADDGRKALEAAFRGHSSLKHCIVVDEDIDIYDSDSVEWALATRFQADRDALVMSQQPGSSLDPSGTPDQETKKTLTAKAGMDATKKEAKGKDFAKAEYAKVELKDYL